MVAHNLMKAIDKCPHYVQTIAWCIVSLSVFGDNFLLAKVNLGLINAVVQS